MEGSDDKSRRMMSCRMARCVGIYVPMRSSQPVTIVSEFYFACFDAVIFAVQHSACPVSRCCVNFPWSSIDAAEELSGRWLPLVQRRIATTAPRGQRRMDEASETPSNCIQRRTSYVKAYTHVEFLGIHASCFILPFAQWLNCPATGGGSLSLKLLDYTFVRLWEKFRTSTKHSIPPCTGKVCFCSQLKYTEP